MTGDGKSGPVEDATRHELFRRLRRATSRRPPVPSPNSSALDPIRRLEGRLGDPIRRLEGGLGAETWVRHEPDERMRVEEILEPVWVIDLELEN
jgi:hypothetical protein